MALGWKSGVAALVVIALLGGIVAYGLVVVDRPRVESVDNSWGTVEENRSEVETEIAVDNPLLLRVSDGAANVRYTVAMNDVRVADEREKRVQLQGRDDVVTVRTWVDNDEIPDWWVTHVNRNETTTVRVDPTVALEYGGVDVPADSLTRERTFRTDLLEPLQTEQTREFSAFNRTALVVNETDAQWGHATAERTPINASATVTNPLPAPLPITNVSYTVRMNGVVVGQGQAGQQTLIPAESTRTIRANATIDNSELDEWWVTHLRNDETTQLSVDFNATVEYAGIERELPLEFVSYNRTFETDVFASSGSGAEARVAAPTGAPGSETHASTLAGRSATDARRPS
ncbi:LEA type 2 family protein [Natronoarchaeum mannanilyticum]|uniref:Water stress and hypersensitive response domain-containing protein n=1 Tax=Natronoarchaeum mannanilyticum TaxID=926360 RepID=A0AAV3T9N6_9EURY